MLSVNFELADKTIDTIELGRFNFADFVSAYLRASENLRGAEKFQALLQRERMLTQVHFKSGSERVIPDVTQLLTMPAAVVKQITAMWDAKEGVPGTVIRDGDGVVTSVLYKLGTPLKFTGGGEAKEITELEFLASTYGQLEEVLTAGNDIVRTLALLKTVANPVEAESLTRLTGFMLDNVTIADGFAIMEKVLPRF